MRDFGELAVLRLVGNVVAAIVQVVAALAHRADGGLTRRRAGKRHRLFGLEAYRLVARFLNAHGLTSEENEANENKRGMSTLSSCPWRKAHPASARRRGNR